MKNKKFFQQIAFFRLNSLPGIPVLAGRLVILGIALVGFAVCYGQQTSYSPVTLSYFGADSAVAGNGSASTAPVNASTQDSSKKSEAKSDDDGDSIAALRKELDEMAKDLKDVSKKLEKKQDVADSSKKFVNKISGIMMLDTMFITQDDANKELYGDANNTTYFRELRLTLSGTGYKTLDYEFSVNFSRTLDYKNLCITAREVPILDQLRIGYFDVESGLHLPSSVFETPFLSHDSATSAFRLSRRVGVASMKFFAEERVRFFTGVFSGMGLPSNQSTTINSNDYQGLILNERVSALPVYSEDTEGNILELMHVGGFGYWIDPGGAQTMPTGYSQPLERIRPTGWEAGNPYMLAGMFPTGTNFSVFGAEWAWQKRQFGVEAEWYVGNYEHHGTDHGGSLRARYCLNRGAYRLYSKNRGSFTGVYVPNNLALIEENGERSFSGFGVWEVAAIWVYADMTNLQILDNSIWGTYNELGLALNWHWNQQVRFGLDWIHAMPNATKRVNGVDGQKIASTNDTVGLQMRLRF